MRVGKCHWRGCVNARHHGEYCEQHCKAALHFGAGVQNSEPVNDGWDGYSAWMVHSDAWEPNL